MRAIEARREPVRNVKHVSAARERMLDRLGIETVDDLLLHAPFRFIDLSSPVTIGSTVIGEDATVIAEIHEVTVKRVRKNLVVTEVALIDETGLLQVSFFNQPWLERTLVAGTRIVVNGTISFGFGFKQMKSPFFEVVDATSEGVEIPLLPIHHVTDGLSTAWMRRIVGSGLAYAADAPDPLPLPLRRKHGLMSRSRALASLHFPASFEEHDEARRRMAYEEVLALELGLMIRRDVALADHEPFVHVTEGSRVAALEEALPFTLTDDQQNAVKSILRDMSEARSMNRMLMGDVGTGKTAVATFALAACADSDTQAVLMAPTSVLANQYARSIGSLLDASGITWAILTGATSAADRATILTRLAKGGLDVLLGTHAVLEPDVVFRRLSLVVIDEQHRFGVDQRARLRAKGPGADLLVMTATPIPRSLALAIYGDLDASFIRERPHGTNPPRTHVLGFGDRGVAYQAIRDAVSAGRQAYVITPLVGVPGDEDEEATLATGSDISDPKAAEKEFEILSSQVFPDLEVGIVTGRMTPGEKDSVMERFRAGEIDVLVATTVIEVGVDVPNATVMMIENAERFGLSQLHQLRGRVGRGEHPGEVYLIAYSRAPQARERLGAMERISDGFELSEFDLASRREGELLGRRQHGAISLRFVDIAEDTDLIAAAHEDARAIVDADPMLEAVKHIPLAIEVIDTYGDVFVEVSGG